MERQARLSLDRILPRLEQRLAMDADPELWDPFRTRLVAHFETLFGSLLHLYGRRYDFFYHLESILEMAARMWRERSPALKLLDQEREAQPDWFQSQQMVGGVCYVDLFGGNLRGIRARIPYFRELGLTYLHLMPLFLAPEGNNDGGYAVSSYREVDPALGTMDELVALPGVGRKTANVVLGNAFGVDEGVVVDTHVRRLSKRLGFTREHDPEKIERDLLGIVPEEERTLFSHLLIFHGRRVCKSRKPDCPNCVLNHVCPSAFEV